VYLTLDIQNQWPQQQAEECVIKVPQSGFNKPGPKQKCAVKPWFPSFTEVPLGRNTTSSIVGPGLKQQHRKADISAQISVSLQETGFHCEDVNHNYTSVPRDFGNNRFPGQNTNYFHLHTAYQTTLFPPI